MDLIGCEALHVLLSLQAAMATRDRLRDKFARFWKANELDLVLCPVFPFPPPPVEEVREGKWSVHSHADLQLPGLRCRGSACNACD